MIGLDANVVVSFIAQDDVMQSANATQLIESLSIESQGLIKLLSMMELVWVMQAFYQVTKKECIVIIDTLLRTREILLENEEVIVMATHLYKTSNADFADCLI